MLVVLEGGRRFDWVCARRRTRLSNTTPQMMTMNTPLSDGRDDSIRYDTKATFFLFYIAAHGQMDVWMGGLIGLAYLSPILHYALSLLLLILVCSRFPSLPFAHRLRVDLCNAIHIYRTRFLYLYAYKVTLHRASSSSSSTLRHPPLRRVFTETQFK